MVGFHCNLNEFGMRHKLNDIEFWLLTDYARSAEECEKKNISYILPSLNKFLQLKKLGKY